MTPEALVVLAERLEQTACDCPAALEGSTSHASWCRRRLPMWQTVIRAAADLRALAAAQPVPGGQHDAACESELTSHGYTPCQCAERKAAGASVLGSPAPHTPVEDVASPSRATTPAADLLARLEARAVHLEEHDFEESAGVLREAAAALRTIAAPPATGWQPIATAPIRQRVLVYIPERSDCAIHGAFTGMLSPYGSWLVDGRPINESLLTHWQPLPAPPTQETEG